MLNSALAPMESFPKRILRSTIDPSYWTAYQQAGDDVQDPIITLNAALESQNENPPPVAAKEALFKSALDFPKQTFTFCHKLAKWCARWLEMKPSAYIQVKSILF